MRFSIANRGGINADGEKLEQALFPEVAIEAVSGDKGVGNDRELGTRGLELDEHVADAGVDVRHVANRLVPQPREVKQVFRGDGEFQLPGSPRSTSA